MRVSVCAKLSGSKARLYAACQRTAETLYADALLLNEKLVEDVVESPRLAAVLARLLRAVLGDAVGEREPLVVARGLEARSPAPLVSRFKAAGEVDSSDWRSLVESESMVVASSVLLNGPW